MRAVRHVAIEKAGQSGIGGICIVKGLCFAGEILDLKADTGGFNLQAAFSTGHAAGLAAAQAAAQMCGVDGSVLKFHAAICD